MPDFIPGLVLCERFFQEAVRPVLTDAFPGLPYSAARIGPGSEVLGFDTPMSTDHDWGPRVQLFLRAEHHARFADAITEALRQRLPHTFLGYPVGFLPPDPADNGTQILDYSVTGPVNHRVEVYTRRGYIQADLGFDLINTVTPADWLSFPSQKLRALTAGAVYHDEVGLQAVRDRFAWYPHDVWLYLLAAGWERIGQEEHLMGRAGFIGDEIGSALIGARLVRDVMRLGFLLERQYAPYPKWFGTAFQRLACAADLTPDLLGALHAESWQVREGHLAAAYERLAALHNALDLTAPIATQTTTFFDRPFRAIFAGRIAEAILAVISDPAVRALARRPLIGGIDQFSDSTDLLSDARWRPGVRALY